MPVLEINIDKIKSPNPFWLASGPVTNTYDQISRAFDMGWGGAVWKTISTETSNLSPRLASLECQGRVLGINNIESLSERSLEDNFKDIYAIKKNYSKNVVLASIAANSDEEWIALTKHSEDALADGIELNFSCPNGVPELGMGLSIGQNSQVLGNICALVKSVTKLPVFAKLTPAVTDIREPAVVAQKNGVDALALINTIPSIIGIDVEKLTGKLNVNNAFTSGGYSGPAIKPIALFMLATLASDKQLKLPISGIGGISDWRDAVEFFALGASSVQVCTAVMIHGYKIIEPMLKGLNDYLQRKNISNISDLVGMALPNFKTWGQLDKNCKVTANIDSTKCIACRRCYLSCNDGGHQCISDDISGNGAYSVIKHKCVGCGLCSLVCPTKCITMQKVF